jgi:elongation factor Ts
MSVAQLVKELRERTGAGMMDCKKALEETGSDMDKAIEWLRENGIAKAAKKGDRVASEGLTKVIVDGNKAIIFELNSETDFVAKNEQFLALIDLLGTNLVNSGVNNAEEALAFVIDGDTVETIISNGTATIGEKLTLRRLTILEKTDAQEFVSYSHMGGRISSVLVVTGEDVETARQVAMHVAASNPKYLDESQVDQEELSKERELLKAEALAEGKPEAIVDKMVEGRVKKYLKEICLLDQSFVVNPDVDVRTALKNANLELASYNRYEVGEGIVKEVVDFAAEVAAQAKI